MMWRPITREQWLREGELYRYLPERQIEEAEVIRCNADWLIARCYVPDTEIGCKVTSAWLLTLGLAGLEGESINWGDLSVGEVKQRGEGAWDITVEEAEPDCPGLRAYICGWLQKWGWNNVRVITEW